MNANGHTTVWGTHIGVGRARDLKGWYHALKDWWAAHNSARHEAGLAVLKARWNAGRETVHPFHADAALDLVASTHAFWASTALSDLAL
jgi:hypothetical protein